MNLKVIFANVSQGFVFAQDIKPPQGMVFRKFSIPEYASFFQEQNPDILCLSEVLIDDINGNSELLDAIKSETKLKYHRIQSSAEHSWIYSNRFYGLGVISRFPISDYEEIKIYNPKYEIDRSNGEHWIMHDKFVQSLNIRIENIDINLFNLHFFPVHHFNKTIIDAKLDRSKRELTDFISLKNKTKPTIITGDFNNKKVPLYKAFPDLFDEVPLSESLITNTTILDDIEQLDHILYSKSNLKLQNSGKIKYLSDHYAIFSTFSL